MTDSHEKRDMHHLTHAEFPLGPFTPYAENPILSPRATAGSPAASTTPPPW